MTPGKVSLFFSALLTFPGAAWNGKEVGLSKITRMIHVCVYRYEGLSRTEY